MKKTFLVCMALMMIAILSFPDFVNASPCLIRD